VNTEEPISVQKKKKKRKGISFNSVARRPTCSKVLHNLPSALSDFSWIENTETNKLRIVEVRESLAEVKKLRDFLRNRASENEVINEEVKID
jgi:hypothetical protein